MNVDAELVNQFGDWDSPLRCLQVGIIFNEINFLGSLCLLQHRLDPRYLRCLHLKFEIKWYSKPIETYTNLLLNEVVQQHSHLKVLQVSAPLFNIASDELLFGDAPLMLGNLTSFTMICSCELPET